MSSTSVHPGISLAVEYYKHLEKACAIEIAFLETIGFEVKRNVPVNLKNLVDRIISLANKIYTTQCQVGFRQITINPEKLSKLKSLSDQMSEEKVAMENVVSVSEKEKYQASEYFYGCELISLISDNLRNYIPFVNLASTNLEDQKNKILEKATRIFSHPSLNYVLLSCFDEHILRENHLWPLKV